tara:strand:+ start:44627 stop:45334 length:708 start_codon:yes stop_codon:yes gene_type:complete
MKTFNLYVASIALLLPLSLFAQTAAVTAPLVTAKIQQVMTPAQALTRLQAGNKRYLNHEQLQSNYIKKAELTVAGQHPAAVVLSCIDARVPPEIIFDQGVGNIFVTRVAANVINPDVLGGMEYATAVTGSKLIVVMGHDSCGAVKGACDKVKLGHLTQLLDKIHPAIEQASKSMHTTNCKNPAYINTIAKDNVMNVVREIPEQSPIIKSLVKQGKIKIIGAMYHLDTGKVSFFSQ